MRCSVNSPDYEYSLREAGDMGGRKIVEARRCGIIFCDLTDFQAISLAQKGLAVHKIGKISAKEVAVPRKVEPYGEEPLTGAELSGKLGLDELRQVVSPPLLGEGYYMAILDTGIRATHEGFNDRIVYQRNFSRSPSYNDVFSHGTSVAWVAAGGAPASGEDQGAAPKAGLLNIKVIDDNGEGSEESVILGIEDVLRLKEEKSEYTPELINLSLGSPDDGDPSNPVRVACRASEENGIFIIAAAGNDGPEPGTITCPAVDPMVWTIGCVESSKGLIAPYSSRGPTREGVIKPDGVSAGDNLILADAHGDKSYSVCSGTSFACAGWSGLTILSTEGFNRAIEAGYISIPSIPGEIPITTSYYHDWIEEHIGDISIKPEGVPPGKDNAYGVGMPIGSIVLEGIRYMSGIQGVPTGMIEPIIGLIPMFMLIGMMSSMAKGAK